MMRTKTIAATALLALAALGGCDRASPAPQPEASDNALPADAGTPVDADVEANLADTAPPPPSAAPAEAPAITPREAPREAPPAPDTQTLDDADATGMTARVHREDMVTNTTP
ncbi:hypothetical protein BH10PSE14_BH10PSE14_43810 [soil metagenome]